MRTSGDLVALVEELTEAHLDTVEMGVEPDRAEWSAHLQYLQALVRCSRASLAARAEPDPVARPGAGPTEGGKR